MAGEGLKLATVVGRAGRNGSDGAAERQRSGNVSLEGLPQPGDCGGGPDSGVQERRCRGTAVEQWAGLEGSATVEGPANPNQDRRRSSGELAAAGRRRRNGKTAAMARQDGGGGTAGRRRRNCRTAATWEYLLSPLLLPRNFLTREVQGLSHGEVTSKVSIFIHQKHLRDNSFLPPLYRREKGRGAALRAVP